MLGRTHRIVLFGFVAVLGLSPLYSQQSDLEIEKLAPDEVLAGEQLRYTIGVFNHGPDTATGITVIDPLPAGVIFCSASFGCSEAAGVVTCSVGSLAANNEAIVNIWVRPEMVDGLSNTASVSGDQNDPNPNNNEDFHETDVLPAADLELDKTIIGPREIEVGSNVTFTIEVTNNGPDDATGVTILDELPVGLTFVSASPGCLQAVGVVTCPIGSLANGASSSVAINVFAGTEGDFFNSATVEGSGDPPDPDPGNNEDMEDIMVLFPSVGLRFLKIGPGRVIEGTDFTYTLTVNHLPSPDPGPDVATGVTITDNLPAGVTFVSASPGCSEAGGVVTCAIGSLALGASSSVNITVRAGMVGEVENFATVSADQLQDPFDPDFVEEAFTFTRIDPPSSDLAVTKSDDRDPVGTSANLSYAIDINNFGPSAATGVALVDTLPAGASFVSASPGCSEANGVVTCIIGSLASGAADSRTVTVTTPGAPTTATNTVSISGDQSDPSLSNNTDAESTTVVDLADLSITMGDAPDPVIVGNNLTYALTITNNGPLDATGVTVTDRLPEGVSFVSASSSSAQSVEPTSAVPGNSAFDGRAAVISITVTAALGDLPSGEEATVTITVGANSTGEVTNSAEVVANETDLNTANNIATQNTRVLAIPPPATPVDAIPTLSGWGMALLLIALLGGGILRLTYWSPGDSTSREQGQSRDKAL